jgi:hypothetical protein
MKAGGFHCHLKNSWLYYSSTISSDLSGQFHLSFNRNKSHLEMPKFMWGIDYELKGLPQWQFKLLTKGKPSP